jgi:uncharacterized protein YjbI with pentapeptide repeats
VLANRFSRKALTQQELDEAVRAHERYLAYQPDGTRANLASTKLNNLDLAKRKLVEADFSFASLVGATAYESDFERAKFMCTDLRDCDLRSASLEQADIRGASMCGAQLAFAKLDCADMRNVTVQYRGPGADGGKTEAIARVDFSNASLRGVSFDRAKLEGVDFTGAILEGANFKNAQLTNVCFKNAVLIGVNLADLAVPAEALEGCLMDMTEKAATRADILLAKLEEHQLCIATHRAKGSQAVLDDEDLRAISQYFAGKELTGLFARRATAFGIDFSGCQLQGARFEGSDLRECKFNGADLRGASFRDAKLSHADFENANLGNLIFPNGKTQAPDFTGAEVRKIQFSRAILQTNFAE